MKLLLINVVCGVKGTGRVCANIATGVMNEGDIVKIAYGRETVPDKYKEYVIRIGSKISVYIDVLLSRFLDNAGFNSKHATKKLIKWIEKYNPDIVHLHNIHGYYINVEKLFNYLNENKKKVIWTLHDCWAFTGHCAYFSKNNCNKWETGCGACRYVREYPKSLFYENSKKNYARKKRIFTSLDNMTIVVTSKWMAELVKKSFLNKYPIELIGVGIDKNIFKKRKSSLRKKYGIENKKIILGVAALWNKRKGVDDFIKISKRLDNNYKVVMLNLSDKQIRDFPDNILKLRKTNTVEELAEWYSTADVFINTTYDDNSPSVNLEAQSCGTPTISYKTGGSIESIPESNIVKQGDIESLIDKIKEICSKNKNEYIDDLQVKEFGIEVANKKYMELYRKMQNGDNK